MEEEHGFDPAKRRLCPDGGCVGVLDATGRCGECGRAFGTGAGPGAGTGTDPGRDADSPGGDAPTNRDPASDSPAVAANNGGSGFDPNRRLCVDGTCVGVIGSSGSCTLCGRVAG